MDAEKFCPTALSMQYVFTPTHTYAYPSFTLSFRMYIIHMYARQSQSLLSSSSPTAVQCFGRLSLCFTAEHCEASVQCWDASLQCCEASVQCWDASLQSVVRLQCSVVRLHCRVLGHFTAECCEASVQSVVRLHCRVLGCFTAVL